MFSKFRVAATRMVVEAISQSSTNPAACFAGKRGSENANCTNNISSVIKEYGSQRLFPHFPDLPHVRLNIPQPIRFYETTHTAAPIANKAPPVKAAAVPLLPRLPPRPPATSGGSKRPPPQPPRTPTAPEPPTPFGNYPNAHNFGRIPKVKPAPGPPPRCDPTMPKRMLTPRYTPKGVQAAVLSLPTFAQDQVQSDTGTKILIWPDVKPRAQQKPPRFKEPKHDLPNLPDLVDIMKTSSCKPGPPAIRKGIRPYVDIAICTPYALYRGSQNRALRHEYIPPPPSPPPLPPLPLEDCCEQLPRKRRARTRRLKGC